VLNCGKGRKASNIRSTIKFQCHTSVKLW